jgi:hypothetical protein
MDDWAMIGITDRDKELAEQARRFFLAGEPIESVALLFALANHEGAKRAIEEMQVALPLMGDVVKQ